MRRVAVPRRLLLVALAAALAGCGSGGDEPAATDRAVAVTQPAPRPALPAGWELHSNEPGGFSLGVPPRWTAERTGTATTLRAPGGRVVVFAARLQGPDARTQPLDVLGRQALERAGFADLRLGSERALRGAAYPAVAIRARGTLTATGVEQVAEAIVLRPQGGEASVLVIFRAAAATAGRARDIVRSYRLELRR